MVSPTDYSLSLALQSIKVLDNEENPNADNYAAVDGSEPEDDSESEYEVASDDGHDEVDECEISEDNLDKEDLAEGLLN